MTAPLDGSSSSGSDDGGGSVDWDSQWPPSSVDAAPVLLQVYTGTRNVSTVTVAPRCADGGPMTGPIATQFPLGCASGNATAQPAHYTVTLTDRVTNRASTATVPMVGGARCASQGYLEYVTNASLVPYVVCDLDVASFPGFSGLTDWRRYDFAVAATWPNGTRTVAAPFRSFFEGQFFASTGGFLPPSSASSAAAGVEWINNGEFGMSQLRQLYEVPDAAVGALNASSSMGILEFTDEAAPGDGFTAADLQAYLATQGNESYYRGGQSLYYLGNVSSCDSDETTLDVLMMAALAPAMRTTIWNGENGPSFPHASYEGAFLGWASDAAGPSWPPSPAVPRTSPSPGPVPPRPFVWSISYGGPEWDDQGQVRLSNYFRLLAAAGITVAAATGDWGASWEFGDPPEALWPASSPHVLAVGGTALEATTANGGAPSEIACSAANGNVITTGGGYSPFELRPAYQASVVGAYDNARVTNATLRRIVSTQRAVPDVAAMATSLYVVIAGTGNVMFGTSAACPLFAAIVALLNDARLARGFAPLRATHEFLYEAHANLTGAGGFGGVPFVDPRRGDNCAGEMGGWTGNYPTFRQCFSAAPGWDAVTGLGSPRFPVLRSVAESWAGDHVPAPPMSTPAPSSSGSGGKDDAATRTHTILYVVVTLGLLLLVAIAVVAAWRHTRRGPGMVGDHGLDSATAYSNLE